MYAYQVNNLQVQDVQTLDARGNPITTKRVQFFVDKNGPFYLTYTQAEYTADKVTADIQREVETLKAIHATATPA